MDKWLMEFDKRPCNNREVPLYFLRKLWEEFILGHHVNYFEISDFHGIGIGFARDQKNAWCDLMLGTFPIR